MAAKSSPANGKHPNQAVKGSNGARTDRTSTVMWPWRTTTNTHFPSRSAWGLDRHPKGEAGRKERVVEPQDQRL